MIETWENDKAARCVNTRRPLARSLDLSEEGIAVQATRICTVADCDKPRRSADYCRAHFGRWQRHGDPTAGRPAPGTSRCSVDGCERPHRARGLCHLHAQRMSRGGSVERTRVRQTCKIEGCERPCVGHGWCGLHYGRWERNGDPMIVLPNPSMLPGAQNCKWVGDAVSYSAAHDRVRKARGPAGDQKCFDCGEVAMQWSYDHLDPDELVEPDDPKQKPYSAKAEHYQPRCLPCHWRMDHPTGKATRT